MRPSPAASETSTRASPEEEASPSPLASARRAGTSQGNSSSADAALARPTVQAAAASLQSSDDADCPATTVELVSEECVICFSELDDEGNRVLDCNHVFHESCINEWIAKDGRCPVCRHVVDEAIALRARQPPGSGFGLADLPAGLPPELARSFQGVAQDAILLQLSRRLMVFATMEAALSVLVMSYIPDMLSPALMLLSACVTFYGANQFSPKAVATCRPILGLNVIYHLYLIARLVHVNEGTPFFDDDYTTARTVLLSLGCVVVMELVALKKAGFFYLRLRTRSSNELDRLRAFRRAQVGWVQRFVIVAMFLLICAPVVAKYLCQADFAVAGDICSS